RRRDRRLRCFALQAEHLGKNIGRGLAVVHARNLTTQFCSCEQSIAPDPIVRVGTRGSRQSGRERTHTKVTWTAISTASSACRHTSSPKSTRCVTQHAKRAATSSTSAWAILTCRHPTM